MEGTRMTMFTVVVAITVLLFVVPDVNAARQPNKKKMVVIQNNYTSYLSLRCFSFKETLDVKHLASGEVYKFPIKFHPIFPSATMYNCSTNMGTFVAYRYNGYTCTDDKYNTWDWKFDENFTYLHNEETGEWGKHEYNPNYESLGRGGVIRGYFVN